MTNGTLKPLGLWPAFLQKFSSGQYSELKEFNNKPKLHALEIGLYGKGIPYLLRS
jgi:hypothetical protein